MSTQGGQFTGAAEQVKANVAGRMEVGWDLALPGGAFHAAQARRALGLALALFLVCLLALPPLASVEAVPRAAPASAPDVPGDEYWAAGFNLFGTSGTVSALSFGPDGSLYAGGYFDFAGGLEATNIARWDGVQWHPLGSGMGGVRYPTVLSLAFGPDGSLYAGGRFTTAGGKPSSNIAQWTGSVVRVPVVWFPVALIDR